MKQNPTPASEKSRLLRAKDALLSTRTLTLCALLCAVAVLVDLFYLPIGGPFLRIYFSFLPAALIGHLCGPALAIPAGIIVDLLSFFVAGGDPAGYFPGYTLSSMLAYLIYALFLFRARITFSRLCLARLTVNVAINVILGSVWKHMLYGKAYSVYFISGAIKNIAILPFEVFLLAIVFAKLTPITAGLGFAKDIPHLTLGKRDILISVIASCVGALVLFLYYRATVSA